MNFTCKYFYVQGLQMEKYIETYAGVPVETEFRKMVAWLDANPSRANKKNWPRFINGWLAKCHGRLLEAQIAIQTRELIRDEQRHRDARIGLWEGYSK